MLTFVVSNVYKDVIEGGKLRSPLTIGAFLGLVLDGAKEIEQERIVPLVVLASNIRNRQCL